MKLYRFMSGKEFQNLMFGKLLTNTADQNKDRGKKSTAIGFCFGIGDCKQAKIDFRRLSGIVTPEYLVVFKPKNIDHFTKCEGIYIDYEATEKFYGDMRLCPLGCFNDNPEVIHDGSNDFCYTLANYKFTHRMRIKPIIK